MHEVILIWEFFFRTKLLFSCAPSHRRGLKHTVHNCTHCYTRGYEYVIYLSPAGLLSVISTFVTAMSMCLLGETEVKGKGDMLLDVDED